VEVGKNLEVLRKVHGILVPGGFGKRGIEGKIAAIRYARENRVPFLGICLGLQCAVIEFARNVCGMQGAHTTEIDKDTPHPVVCLMEEQEKVVEMGATMRLGAWPCTLKVGTKAAEAYEGLEISERHRHRFEVNNSYRTALEAKGLVLSGLSPDGKLVELIELPDHPWFVGTQAHPELKSQPVLPHPLFKAFVGAAIKRKQELEVARKTHAGVG
jgi:CTP synthase